DPDSIRPASCRAMQAGSLRSPERIANRITLNSIRSPSFSALDLNPNEAAEKNQEQDQEQEQESAEKRCFSARPLSLPTPRHFRHSSPPYALVSANVRSAKQTPAFCPRDFGHRGRQLADGGRRQPGRDGGRARRNKQRSAAASAKKERSHRNRSGR